MSSDPSAPQGALEELLAELTDDGRIVHVESIAARPARFAETTVPIAPHVLGQLDHQGLYTHQAEAIDHALAGRSVVVATGTASGKSLCYQIPIAHHAADHTAICVFPTKALAQDQLRSLGSMDFPGVVPATFDGDTDFSQRSWVRNRANVILTNPEMLHNAVLPNHPRWSGFLRRLRYIVIDELHTYRGVFGTHMAHVLRRLRRLCMHHGGDPVFVFSSATIGEPERLATELCGLPVSAVTDDGSPAGPRKFALLNPPVVDEALGLRSSTTAETSSIVAALVKRGHRTIAFTASRKGTELVAGDVRRRLNGKAANSIRSYRSGYLANERREIEAELAAGEVMGVISTSALELGVDIGGLDACVLSGFPGTIASMWQQAGRAGRGGQLALAVLVAGDDMLDQWLMAHPTEVFSRQPEPAVVNISNPFIADPHLACAAYELPLAHADADLWPDIDDSVRRLVQDDKLLPRPAGAKRQLGVSARRNIPSNNNHSQPDTDHHAAGAKRQLGVSARRNIPSNNNHSQPDGPPPRIAVWTGRGSPARGIGLRSGSSTEIKIQLADGTLVGTVDAERAPRLVHTGAIYLHRGISFRVEELDLEQSTAIVTGSDGTEYTQPRTITNIAVIDEDDHRMVGPAHLSLGQVEVTTQVTGYQRKERRTRKILGNHPLDLPPQILRTRAFWYTVDDALLEAADLVWADLPGTLHAAEHAAIGMLPLFTICDRWDVGGVSTAHHADTGRPSIFIYDGYPGGTGIAELGYGAADRHLRATLELIEACACESGCPSCVQSPKCGNGNDPLDKAGAIRLLDAIARPHSELVPAATPAA